MNGPRVVTYATPNRHTIHAEYLEREVFLTLLSQDTIEQILASYADASIVGQITQVWGNGQHRWGTAFERNKIPYIRITNWRPTLGILVHELAHHEHKAYFPQAWKTPHDKNFRYFEQKVARWALGRYYAGIWKLSSPTELPAPQKISNKQVDF